MKDFIKKSIILRKLINPSKRCPFCGAAAEGKLEKDATGKQMYYVECVQCNARTKGYRLVADAVKHWDNQRYDTKQKKGEWVCKKDDQGLYIECSVCQAQYGYVEEEMPPYCKYCPECGARLIQTELDHERKISLEDQVEMADRIKIEKNEKNKNLKIEKYWRQEMAEQFLQEMIGIDDDEEEDSDEDEQPVH